MQTVHESVILAAGQGSRLRRAVGGVPKPLVRVAGRPLIAHALRQACEAGCDRAVVVVGRGADAVAGYLRDTDCGLDVQVVFNPSHREPNGVSLLAAEPHVRGRFYLQMADHVFESPVLAHLGADTDGGMKLLVDRAPGYSDEEDATKVRVQAGRVVALGKELRRWDAIDTGVFLLGPGIFSALRRAQQNGPPSVTAGMLELVATGALKTVELERVAWVDVDTARDLAVAEQLLTSRAAGGTVLSAVGSPAVG